MRTVLIAIQAGVISIFAVMGAQSDSDAGHNCPLPSATADAVCHDTHTTDL